MGLEWLFGGKAKTPQPKVEETAQAAAQQPADGPQKTEFYRRIIARYAALINESEEKTVPELKSLIRPHDGTVLELKKKVLSQWEENRKSAGDPAGVAYAFQSDFLWVADRALAYVRQMENLHSDLPVTFWLSPQEMTELQGGDLFDKAVLLASLIKALGGPAKVRVLELEKNRIHPVVVFTFEERAYVLDASQPECGLTTYSGNLEETLARFSYEGNKYVKSAYEFSDLEYQEFG